MPCSRQNSSQPRVGSFQGERIPSVTGLSLVDCASVALRLRCGYGGAIPLWKRRREREIACICHWASGLPVWCAVLVSTRRTCCLFHKRSCHWASGPLVGCGVRCPLRTTAFSWKGWDVCSPTRPLPGLAVTRCYLILSVRFSLTVRRWVGAVVHTIALARSSERVGNVHPSSFVLFALLRRMSCLCSRTCCVSVQMSMSSHTNFSPRDVVSNGTEYACPGWESTLKCCNDEHKCT